MKRAEADVVVRAKNQVTIPQSVADRFDLTVGQRLVIVDEGAPDEFTVRVIRASYAGALAGVFSESPAENVDYLRGERESWE